MKKWLAILGLCMLMLCPLCATAEVPGDILFTESFAVPQVFTKWVYGFDAPHITNGYMDITWANPSQSVAMPNVYLPTSQYGYEAEIECSVDSGLYAAVGLRQIGGVDYIRSLRESNADNPSVPGNDTPAYGPVCHGVFVGLTPENKLFITVRDGKAASEGHYFYQEIPSPGSFAERNTLLIRDFGNCIDLYVGGKKAATISLSGDAGNDYTAGTLTDMNGKTYSFSSMLIPKNGYMAFAVRAASLRLSELSISKLEQGDAPLHVTHVRQKTDATVVTLSGYGENLCLYFAVYDKDGRLASVAKKAVPAVAGETEIDLAPIADTESLRLFSWRDTLVPVDVPFAANEEAELLSPNGRIRARVYIGNDNHLLYDVTRDGQTMLSASRMGVITGGIDIGANATITGSTFFAGKDSYALYGAYSQIDADYNAATYTVEGGGKEYIVEFRVYDSGVTFRYLFHKDIPIDNETTTFAVSPDATAFQGLWLARNQWDYPIISDELSYYPIRVGSMNCNFTNATYIDPSTLHYSTGDVLAIPATLQLPNGQYVCITEADVEGYSGMSMQYHTGRNDLQIMFLGENRALNRLMAAGTVNTNIFNYNKQGFYAEKTPWRIIMMGSDLQELSYGQTLVTNVSEPMNEAFYADSEQWMIPGKTGWSWLKCTSAGYNGVTYEKSIEFIDASAEMGFDYYLIDDGFNVWPDAWNKIKTLATYAKDRGIRLLLWKNSNEIFREEDMENFFSQCEAIGIAGVKVDFIDSTSVLFNDWYERALICAAKHKLFVNFHGCNHPTGLSRTYPNEFNREGIRGYENPLYLEQGTYLPFTRMLAGVADFTPTFFANQQNAHIITEAANLAQSVIYSAPLLCFAEHPYEMTSNRASDFLKTLPTVWDETQVFPQSRVGVLAALRRESKGHWYIVALSNDGEDFKTDLSFLGEGTYFLQEFKDYEGMIAMQPHYGDTSIKTITKEGTLSAHLVRGGGYVATLSKVRFARCGGFASRGLVEILTSDDGTVYYTTDGSAPTTASSVYSAPFFVDNSCTVRVLFVDKYGQRFETKANFNKKAVHVSITAPDTVYVTDKTNYVSLYATYNENGVIRYTTDGSEPNNSSAIYTGPFSLRADKGNTQTVRATYFINGQNNGSVSKTVRFVGYDLPDLPDVYLDGSYTNATCGYSTGIHVGASTDRNQLYVGGMRFNRGIGTHAPSNLTYKVPENAVRFVSVFGVDNEVSDERASIRCQIYFDGNLAHTTGVVSAGGYEIIDVKVPHGTKSMTISITDEGSNIYDHASLGNAGFVTTASDIRQNPDIYLSSDWVSETHGWTQPIGVNQSIDGDAIRLNGKTYTHGIATHADSTIVYNIPAGATRFVARGGIDDEVTSCIADVIFKVYIDGKLCYQSPFVSKYEACGIDVAIPTGAERITLEVTAGSSAEYDHATWANAGFIQ